MVNSKYFPNLLEIIDPQTFEFLSKLCNFEENFDYLQLKVQFQYFLKNQLLEYFSIYLFL